MKRVAWLSSIFVWGLIILSPVSAASLKNYFTDVTTMRANFHQTVLDSGSQPLQESEGTITIQRPEKFNLEYSKPYHQLYVADGEYIWAYDEDLEQVTVKKQNTLLQNSPALILTNPDQLEKNYSVTELENQNGLARFSLKPKGEQGSFERLILSFKGNRIRLMEMHDNFGQITFLRFSKVQLNPLLDEKVFKFTPPEGVDVIQADEAL